MNKNKVISLLNEIALKELGSPKTWQGFKRVSYKVKFASSRDNKVHELTVHARALNTLKKSKVYTVLEVIPL